LFARYSEQINRLPLEGLPVSKEEKWRRQLGRCIQRIRIRHGWAQHELASRLRKCGFRRCSRTLLSHIEIGVANIRGHEIYYLRQVFGEAFEQDFWHPCRLSKDGDASFSGETRA
jgi:transcriptional regulator with XRE-family HTH domain